MTMMDNFLTAKKSLLWLYVLILLASCFNADLLESKNTNLAEKDLSSKGDQVIVEIVELVSDMGTGSTDNPDVTWETTEFEDVSTKTDFSTSILPDTTFNTETTEQSDGTSPTTSTASTRVTETTSSSTETTMTQTTNTDTTMTQMTNTGTTTTQMTNTGTPITQTTDTDTTMTQTTNTVTPITQTKNTDTTTTLTTNTDTTMTQITNTDTTVTEATVLSTAEASPQTVPSQATVTEASTSQETSATITILATSTAGQEATTVTETTEVSTTQELTSTTNTVTTSTQLSTTTISAQCNPGFFGANCSFTCNCLDARESCDSLTGFCVTGCAPGFYGPGCLAREYGDLSVIVFLSVLLVLFLILCLAQCIYIMVYKPYRKRMKATDTFAAHNEAYELEDGPAQPIQAQQVDRERQSSSVPMNEMSRGIPRIKERDIQVTSDVLGRGRFGEVLKGALTTNKGSVPVAFKTIGDDATEDTREAFKGHLEVNSRVQENDNVIRFYGVAIVGGDAFAAFEYASNGNLRNFLRLNDEITFAPRGKLLQFALDVAQGMRHLSKKQIIHRELCCEHVLVTENLTAKITSLHTQNRAVKNKLLRWMSPQVLVTQEYSTASDIWSYGILFWEIMSLGNVPYSDVEVNKLPSYLDAGSRLSRPENCDSDIYGLMRWCWHANPEDRPTFVLLSNTIQEMMDSGQIRLDLEDSDVEEV